MANLKEVRERITSTQSTQQITKAMKLVSATKLRLATNAIVKMRPYADKLDNMIQNLGASAASDEGLENLYNATNENGKTLLVIVSSDRGLCGGFNANISKKVIALIGDEYAEQYKAGQIEILPVGKKAYENLKNGDYNFNLNHIAIFQKLKSEVVFELGDWIISEFKKGTYSKVDIIYNKFKNAATQIITQERILPVDTANNIEFSDKKSNNDYIFEPNKTELLQELIPRSLKTKLYRSVLDSHASEHGARMVSMDQATDNAGELIKDLKLVYNQARQAAITNEIMEIVGGAAAL